MNKRITVVKDCLDGIVGGIYFSDGSWAEIEHMDGWTSASGTGWPEELNIYFYEKKVENKNGKNRTSKEG